MYRTLCVVAGVLERRPPDLCSCGLELALEGKISTQNGSVWVEPQPELVEKTNGNQSAVDPRVAFVQLGINITFVGCSLWPVPT